MRGNKPIFIFGLIDKYIRRGQWLYCCFVDFKAAFDSISRNALLFKLVKFGIGGNFLKVIKDMYSDVSYCINVNGGLTEEFNTSFGVKQGCVLSPLLFNMFISDLPQIFDSNCDPAVLWDIDLSCLQFADDLILMSESAKGLQTALDKLSAYCETWGLEINLCKTKILIFNSNGRLIRTVHFFLNGMLLDNVRTYSYLGITFTASGSFTNACSILLDKANKALFKLKQLGTNHNISVALSLFQSLIQPIITYGCEIWAPFLVNLEEGTDFYKAADDFPAEKLLLKFAKYLLCVRRNACSLGVRGELGLFPIICPILISICKNWQRIINCDPSTFIRKTYINYCDSMSNPRYSGNNYASTIKNILYYFDHNSAWTNQGFRTLKNVPKSFEKNVYHRYSQSWMRSLHLSDKLRTYRTFKATFELENYLLQHPLHKRKCLSRLRISAHHLNIEYGRYHKPRPIPYEQRLCEKCNSGAIEDEFHALMECAKHAKIRQLAFSQLEEFTLLASFRNEREKFKFLMSSAACDHEIGNLLMPLIVDITT